MLDIQRVRSRELGDLVTPRGEDVLGIPGMGQLAATGHIETLMRVYQLAMRERTKAMVMFLAAQDGTNTVGFWSND